MENMEYCGSGRVYGAADGASDHMHTFLHQSQKFPPPPPYSSDTAEAIDPLWLPNPTSSSSPSFHAASETMVVNYEDAHESITIDQMMKRESMAVDKDELSNCGGDQQSVKKRRLTVEQVQFLEKSFDVENRLEPDRKVQLAKELNLQPRQVAIWFQNRRARFKSKQLEKDYDSLKADYDGLKANYESILKEKDRLENEVTLLTNKLKQKGKGLPDSDPRGSWPEEVAAYVASDNYVGKMVVVCKQEDASSAKSDVLDSESAYGTDAAYDHQYSSLLEPANSSNIFEPEQSDFSQDEDDQYLGRSLLQPSLPKLEEYYIDDPQCSSGTFALPAEDQQLWSWLCQT